MKPQGNKKRSRRRKRKPDRPVALNKRSEEQVPKPLSDPQIRHSTESALAPTSGVDPSILKQSEVKPVKASGSSVKKKVGVFFAIFGGIAVVVGFLADVGGLYSTWQNKQPISVGIAWYEKKDTSLRLVPLDAVIVELAPEDVFNQRVSIPVNLAIANKEAAPLEVVRVELNYDKNLKVESTGKVKIDPSNELLVYEHTIGTLESLGFYTPLETIDTIHVPFVFHVVPVIARSRDGVPFYLVTIVGYEGQKFADKVVQLGVRILCRDRPALTGVIRFHLRAGVQLIGLSDIPPNIIDVNKEDVALFQRIPLASEPLVHWKRRDSKEGFLVDYNKVKFSGGIYQYILIDGVIRKVNADTDADGRLDYEMFDSTGDGLPEKKAIASKPEAMLDWPEYAMRQ
jgi:hypothetical protein